LEKVLENVGKPPIYRYDFTVSADAIDGNGHVNNVAYVQWMQDVAIRHSDDSGCTQAAKDAGATWVVRKHGVEYLRPAFEGDPITVMTWISSFRRALSLRKYKFIRTSDNAVLSRGETDWVFVDAASGRPRTIPQEVKGAFTLVPLDQEP
jgi:acyl-CoA thioester hydrolase